MGSSSRDTNNPNQPIKLNPLIASTQPLDSQFTQPYSPGEEWGDGNCVLNTEIVEDDETQVLNLGGETQVLDYDDETQVLDCLDGCDFIETQLLDDKETQLLDDNDTQLLEDFDHWVDDDRKSERSDRTEDLGDSDDDAASGCDGESLRVEKTMCSCPDKENNKAGVSNGDCCKTGSEARFASIRVTSLRASGKMAGKGINGESYSVSTSGLSSDHHTFGELGVKDNVVEEVDQVLHLVKEDEVRKDNKSKVCTSTVRKLVFEESFPEDKRPSDNSEINIAKEKDLPQLSFCDNEIAGLSYVDSQEPGEESEAEALKFVATLIEKNNVLEFHHEVDCRRRFGGKSNPVSSFIGPQNLAKKAYDRSKGREAGIFDWDDTHENEGGGEIFCRKKEEFFGWLNHKKSYSEPQKSRKKKVATDKDDEEPVDVQNKDTVHSDSRVMLGATKRNANKALESLKRNLVRELDEKSDASLTRGEAETVVANNNVSEILDVGPDTQIAAEAMEALISAEGITHHNISGPQLESNVSQKRSLRENCIVKGFSNKPTSKKRACIPAGVATRQSKRIKSSGVTSSEQSLVSLVKLNVREECDRDTTTNQSLVSLVKLNVREECDRDTTTTNTKKAKVPAKGNGTYKSGNNSNQVHALDKINSKEINRCLRSGALSTGQLIEETNLTEKAGISTTPVAKRTRHSVLVKNLRRSEHVLDETVAGCTDLHVSATARKKSDVKSALLNKAGELGNRNQNDEPVPNLTSDSNFTDASTHPRKRRSCRILSRKGNESGNLEAQSKQDFVQVKTVKPCKRKGVEDLSTSARNTQINGRLDESPVDKHKVHDSSYGSPDICMTPVNAASPVCKGDEYFKQSCKKNLMRSGLLREINSIRATEPEPISPPKDLRKRKDMAEIRVLFSNHLDEDIIKQQKKILARIGASEATSITDATHFITDNFVRTRNMLEAIAFGKPVVTHLWLESMGQVKLYMDEEAFLLRDSRKEKEFGFSMPASLARSRKNPLLQGRRVLITPNTKPGKETIARLVTAVRGQAVERIGRSAMKDVGILEDLLILSCEEDYEICVPFLEKGVAVYSSELLLNGIVTQKLEFERHRIFDDRVKRTRSTVWLKKDKEYHTVTRHKQK